MSLTLTANDLIRTGLITLGVLDPLEQPTPSQSAQGFYLLREMVDNWSTQALTVVQVSRNVYNMVADQGGPDDPYTIGPGGDFNTGTLPRPLVIRNAALLLTDSQPYPVEIPLPVITDDMFAATQVKSLSNSLPTTLYYNPSDPLGEIILWPIPDIATNDLVLYTDAITPQFSSQLAAYVCPPGYAKAFRLCLAQAMINSFAVDPVIAQRTDRDATEAFADLKAVNVKMADLTLDPALTPFTGKYGWAIQTGP